MGKFVTWAKSRSIGSANFSVFCGNQRACSVLRPLRSPAVFDFVNGDLQTAARKRSPVIFMGIPIIANGPA
jgi:hypothetical protein